MYLHGILLAAGLIAGNTFPGWQPITPPWSLATGGSKGHTAGAPTRRGEMIWALRACFSQTLTAQGGTAELLQEIICTFKPSELPLGLQRRMAGSC